MNDFLLLIDARAATFLNERYNYQHFDTRYFEKQRMDLLLLMAFTTVIGIHTFGNKAT